MTGIIVGYINDCVPRFVEIGKSEIRRLLFNPTVGSNHRYTVLLELQSVTVEKVKRIICRSSAASLPCRKTPTQWQRM
jgi:hypothetical protein